MIYPTDPALCLPRVGQQNAEPCEIGGVACGDGQAVDLGRGGDQGIGQMQGAASSRRDRAQRGGGSPFDLGDGQHTVLVEGDELLDGLGQALPPPARLQTLQPKAQLMERDHAEIAVVQGCENGRHLRIAVRPGDFGDHIGVQEGGRHLGLLRIKHRWSGRIGTIGQRQRFALRHVIEQPLPDRDLVAIVDRENAKHRSVLNRYGQSAYGLLG